MGRTGGILVCGWAATALWLRGRAWRAGRDPRAKFEKAAAGPFDDGRIIALKGQLEQRGAACTGFENGSPTAVSSVRTLKLAIVVSAEHLVLRGAQTVAIDGQNTRPLALRCSELLRMKKAMSPRRGLAS
jgi:hypothetical protein